MKASSRRKRLPANVMWVSLASMFNDISGEIVTRGLPLYLSSLGLGFSTIGMIEGLADTTSSLLKVASGWYSDKWGSRKHVAATGYLLTAVARPILYFATSWVLPLVSRFLDRAGKGIRTAPRDALIADSVAPQDRGRAFGLHRALDPLGAVLGGIIAAVALYYLDAPISASGTYELTDEMFRLLIALAMIPTFISVLIFLVLVKDPKRAGDALTRPRLLGVGIDRRFNKLLAIILIFTLGASSDAFVILKAQQVGLTPVEIFVVIALFNLVTTLASYPAGVLSDKLDRRTLIRIGWVYYAAIYTLLAFASEQWHLWVLFIAYGLYYGLTEGVEKAYVADLVLPEHRGTAYGLYNGTVGIMLLPASLIAGVLWQNFGSSAPFLFGAVLALLAATALTFLNGRTVAADTH